MDMNPGFNDQVVFHLTGRRAAGGIEPIEGLGLRPALFAQFGDLTRLRYDYPLVLADGAADAPVDTEAVQSLSGMIDALLRDIAPRGPEGERLRSTLFHLEREIRTLLAEGAPGRLSALWSIAAERLIIRGGAPVQTDLARARAALSVEGTLIDCVEGTPARVVEHLWRAVEQSRSRAMRRTIDALAQRLGDLIRADHLRSQAGRGAAALKAGIGARHQDLFDFGTMAQLLARPSGQSALPPARRRRMETALQTLRAQRFFAADGYSFMFDAVDAALEAYRARLPAMADLVKAVSIAELEVEGRYVEAKHDATFAAFDAGALRPEDIALFPRALVRIPARGSEASTRLIEALASGAPLKVLVEIGELLDSASLGEEHFSFGARLATSALGLNDVFVVQSAASNLHRMRDRLCAALDYAGPALVSVYAGTGVQGIAPYLVAAAAMQSRAFPAFSHDPTAGGDWGERFTLEDNPQPTRPWPTHAFEYADSAHQRVRTEHAFTFVDFVACNPRYARHYARVPREHCNGAMVPVGDWLASAANGTPETVPCVDVMDAANRLHKLVVDEKIVHAARRCADAWRRLQEFDRLKRKPEAAPVVTAPAPAVATSAAGAATTAPAAVTSAPGAAAPAPSPEGRPTDDAFIETERCTSCNECTQINSAMFAYNANKQAYIASPDAGTYRQLVEAAESCQVSIIHPGKPRNPKEPGLDELVQRAEPFR